MVINEVYKTEYVKDMEMRMQVDLLHELVSKHADMIGLQYSNRVSCALSEATATATQRYIVDALTYKQMYDIASKVFKTRVDVNAFNEEGLKRRTEVYSFETNERTIKRERYRSKDSLNKAMQRYNAKQDQDLIIKSSFAYKYVTSKISKDLIDAILDEKKRTYAASYMVTCMEGLKTYCFTLKQLSDDACKAINDIYSADKTATYHFDGIMCKIATDFGYHSKDYRTGKKPGHKLCSDEDWEEKKMLSISVMGAVKQEMERTIIAISKCKVPSEDKYRMMEYMVHIPWFAYSNTFEQDWAFRRTISHLDKHIKNTDMLEKLVAMDRQFALHECNYWACEFHKDVRIAVNKAYTIWKKQKDDESKQEVIKMLGEILSRVRMDNSSSRSKAFIKTIM